jgi:hypothetical protein
MLKGVEKRVNYVAEIHGRLAKNSCYCETPSERLDRVVTFAVM